MPVPHTWGSMNTVVLDAPAPPIHALAFTPTDLPEHIEDRIEVRHVSVEDVKGPCWLWTRITNDRGYGQLKRSGRVVTIHRTGFELLVGPIPAGLEFGQSCLVHACCNPGHLVAATRAEHHRRRKGATGQFCVKGHPRLLENQLVIGRDVAGDPAKVTCRSCAHHAGVSTQRPFLAATAAVVLAWT
ncbi:HNH endonuclease [Kocuria arenosa]|uniref:HNH endonuclease n=1 Tax=Kocuria arenosa TaxID=3071446 RepID=UPI0034D3D3A9